MQQNSFFAVINNKITAQQEVKSNNIKIKEKGMTVSSYDAMNSIQLVIKRLIDFTAALIGLVVLSPIFVLIYVLLKRQKNGPAIFSQERIGYGGKPFPIYKFRTLSTQEQEPQLIPLCDEKNATKTERFLREHHLDELPQLWNVVKGDMSFVGPRPERKFYIDQIMAIDNNYNLIYKMRPGLTSEATLYNGYTDTMEKMLIRLNMDIEYLKKRSLWLDMKIIIKTAISIISGKKF